MKQSFTYFLLSVTIIMMLSSCVSKRNILTNSILKDPFIGQIASNPEHEVQILYTHVDLKDTSFTTSSYKLDNNLYFYPASTVKMPVAILALQKKNELNKQGIELMMTDEMLTAANRPVQTPAFIDTTNTSGKPAMERYIQKIFAVSDNDAYNRLYEFLGQDYINQSLKNIGMFKTSAICNRLSVSGYTPEENKHTNNVRFFRNKKVVYDKPTEYATKDWFHQARASIKGKGYVNANDSLVMQPFDFSKKNFYSIADMEGTLRRIIFPEKFRPEQRFDLKSEDYTFLKKCMSDLPKNYGFYKANPEYYDSYVKFFMFGDSKESIPDGIKIYNKVGNAYGYLIDCAYIEDKEKGIGFFLTAIIHVNKDQIYNDEKYEYESIGFPFLSRLGRAVYEHEVNIKKN